MRPNTVRSFLSTTVSMSAAVSVLLLSACADQGPAESNPGPLVEVAALPAHQGLIASASASQEVQGKLEALRDAGWAGGDRAAPLANGRGDLAVGFHFTGPAAETALDLIYVPTPVGDSNVVVRPASAASAALFRQTIRAPKEPVSTDDDATAAGTPLEIAATVDAASSCGRLSANQALTTNQTLYSCHNGYRLVMQKDGNAVSYIGSTATWASNTAGKGGARIIMQSDGNLVVYTSGGTALWASHTNGHSGAYFRLQDDGNLVVYSSAGKALWSSGTYCDSGCTGACRGWSCDYVSSTGIVDSCIDWTKDGPLGGYFITTVRSGHTDPAHCVAVYADADGRGVSCPSPSKTLTYLTCGQP